MSIPSAPRADDDERQTVFVIDDDAGMRDAVRMLLESIGLRVEMFHCAAAFQDRMLEDPPGCLVTDVRMPGMDGLAIQRHLRAADRMLPVIFISGHADVALGVEAMRAGAYGFLTKPFREQELLEAVTGALALERSGREERRRHRAICTAFETLDPREREIMAEVSNGTRNKTIASRLRLSEITIKVARARIMRKMGVESTAQLARLAERLGIR